VIDWLLTCDLVLPLESFDILIAVLDIFTVSILMLQIYCEYNEMKEGTMRGKCSLHYRNKLLHTFCVKTSR